MFCLYTAPQCLEHFLDGLRCRHHETTYAEQCLYIFLLCELVRANESLESGPAKGINWHWVACLESGQATAKWAIWLLSLAAGHKRQEPFNGVPLFMELWRVTINYFPVLLFLALKVLHFRQLLNVGLLVVVLLSTACLAPVHVFSSHYGMLIMKWFY